MEVSWLFFLSFFSHCFHQFDVWIWKNPSFPLTECQNVVCIRKKFGVGMRTLISFIDRLCSYTFCQKIEMTWSMREKMIENVFIYFLFWHLDFDVWKWKYFFAFSPWTGALIVILRTRPKLQRGEQKVPKKQKGFSVSFNQFRYNTKLLCQPYL